MTTTNQQPQSIQRSAHPAPPAQASRSAPAVSAVDSNDESGHQPTYEELRAQLAALQAQQGQQAADSEKASVPLRSAEPDADSYVTVLHGYGRVGAKEVSYKSAPGKKTPYMSTGGVVRNVLYSDAKHWQKLWGAEHVHILPADADEVDFARKSGIQPMELSKLAAMLEAVSLDQLIAAWGEERATAWTERVAKYLEAQSLARPSTRLTR